MDRTLSRVYSINYKFMLLTPHTFVGIAIGFSIQRPEFAVPVSVATHFLGDLIPHWDFYSHTSLAQRRVGWRPVAVMADLVLGVSVGLFFTFFALWVLKNPSLALNVFLCGIGSVLPDALEAPHIFMDKDFKFLQPLLRTQKKLQIQAPLPWGIISQLFVIAVALIVILS